MRIVISGLALGLMLASPSALLAQKDNTLTAAEKKNGWQLLFDGKTTQGWRGAYLDQFPAQGWVVEKGTLTHLPAAGGESNSGGDIITEGEYDNFELELDFNVAEGGNSGIKYFVVETKPKPEGSAIGLEFQILDDERHPDAKKGRDGNRTIGSLYDLIPASASKKPNPPGQWNHARLVVRGGKVEHYLNGVKTVSYDRFSAPFDSLVAISKYKDKPGFGKWPKGHILLQDHGDRVSYKNIKIRVLPASKS